MILKNFGRLDCRREPPPEDQEDGEVGRGGGDGAAGGDGEGTVPRLFRLGKGRAGDPTRPAPPFSKQKGSGTSRQGRLPRSLSDHGHPPDPCHLPTRRVVNDDTYALRMSEHTP